MKRYVLVIILVLGVLVAWADEVRKITLDEAILLARSQSVDAAMALNELKSAYWEYRS